MLTHHHPSAHCSLLRNVADPGQENHPHHPGCVHSATSPMDAECVAPSRSSASWPRCSKRSARSNKTAKSARVWETHMKSGDDAGSFQLQLLDLDRHCSRRGPPPSDETAHNHHPTGGYQEFLATRTSRHSKQNNSSEATFNRRATTPVRSQSSASGYPPIANPQSRCGKDNQTRLNDEEPHFRTPSSYPAYAYEP